MKVNWKALIASVYISFVSMILLLVGMSAGQKIDLVTDHYYEEELKFQGKIDKLQRAAELTEPLSWQIKDNALQIRYPATFADSSISGQIRVRTCTCGGNSSVIATSFSHTATSFPLSYRTHASSATWCTRGRNPDVSVSRTAKGMGGNRMRAW